MWFYGFDLMGHCGPVELKGQWMTGHADGEAAEGVYGLDLHQGGYLELDAMLTSSLGILGRGEYRDAFVWLGDRARLRHQGRGARRWGCAGC